MKAKLRNIEDLTNEVADKMIDIALNGKELITTTRLRELSLIEKIFLVGEDVASSTAAVENARKRLELDEQRLKEAKSEFAAFLNEPF